jgi:hypothetical protein
MSEPRGNWLWNLLRKKKRRDLDRIQMALVKLPGEKREFAGDPAQAPHLRVPLKHK